MSNSRVSITAVQSLELQGFEAKQRFYALKRSADEAVKKVAFGDFFDKLKRHHKMVALIV